VDFRFDQELPRSKEREQRITYAAGVAGSDGIVHTGIGPFRVDDDSYFSYGRAAYSKGAFRAAAEKFDVGTPQSALAKARRPSPSLLPELLARLSALAKERHFSPLLLTALLACVSAFAKAKPG